MKVNTLCFCLYAQRCCKLFQFMLFATVGNNCFETVANSCERLLTVCYNAKSYRWLRHRWLAALWHIYMYIYIYIYLYMWRYATRLYTEHMSKCSQRAMFSNFSWEHWGSKGCPQGNPIRGSPGKARLSPLLGRRLGASQGRLIWFSHSREGQVQLPQGRTSKSLHVVNTNENKPFENDVGSCRGLLAHRHIYIYIYMIIYIQTCR